MDLAHSGILFISNWCRSGGTYVRWNCLEYERYFLSD